MLNLLVLLIIPEFLELHYQSRNLDGQEDSFWSILDMENMKEA